MLCSTSNYFIFKEPNATTQQMGRSIEVKETLQPEV